MSLRQPGQEATRADRDGRPEHPRAGAVQVPHDEDARQLGRQVQPEVRGQAAGDRHVRP